MINYYELVKNNPEYFKQFSCKDLLFLNYDCPVKLKKVAKWSQHHYVYYVLSGKKTLHTTEESLTLTSGSIAFVKKGACIVEQFFEEPFCIIVFIIPDSFIVSFLNDYLPGRQASVLSNHMLIPIQDDIHINAFYQSILPYFTSQAEIPEALMELKFKELLLHFLNNPRNEELKNFFLSIRQQGSSPLKEIMETNYAYNMTIEEYAKLANRSVSSFKRDFQSLFKTTPGKWLMDMKLKRAKRLLLETDNSVGDIAFDSGFENATHFCRLFKQKTGITPLEYRKKEKELSAV